MSPQELEVQEKKELESQEEETKVGRYFVPATDIHETETQLLVNVEMPGVDKDNIDIKLEKNTLTITGNVDLSKYDGLQPVYTEYNVGHFTRSFTISNAIDSDAISASMEGGVLQVRLPKRDEVKARQIEVR